MAKDARVFPSAEPLYSGRWAHTLSLNVNLKSTPNSICRRLSLISTHPPPSAFERTLVSEKTYLMSSAATPVDANREM